MYVTVNNCVGKFIRCLIFNVDQSPHCYEAVKLLHVFVEQRNTAKGPVDFRPVERLIICSVDTNGAARAGITVRS